MKVTMRMRLLKEPYLISTDCKISEHVPLNGGFVEIIQTDVPVVKGDKRARLVPARSFRADGGHRGPRRATLHLVPSVNRPQFPDRRCPRSSGPSQLPALLRTGLGDTRSWQPTCALAPAVP